MILENNIALQYYASHQPVKHPVTPFERQVPNLNRRILRMQIHHKLGISSHRAALGQGMADIYHAALIITDFGLRRRLIQRTTSPVVKKHTY